MLCHSAFFWIHISMGSKTLLNANWHAQMASLVFSENGLLHAQTDMKISPISLLSLQNQEL